MTNNPEGLAELLQQEAYVANRLEPNRGDLDYLPNEDLRKAVLMLCKSERGRVLDYGCGGSPYQSALPQFSPYVRADITPAPGIDLVLDASGRLPGEVSGSYDVVLSTQVLEHVPRPDEYLAEALRLLRPGGSIILTTHGLVPEHGCPYDFHRWTGEGLGKEFERAGFVVEENYKLTLNMRASIFLMNYSVFCVFMPKSWLAKQFGKVLRRVYRLVLVKIANRIGDAFADDAMLSSSVPRLRPYQNMLYVGVAIRARKPAIA